MRWPLRSLAPVALLACLACQPRVPAPVYGPWEEGLTLAFEDPSRPQPQRMAERLQLRVARSTLAPGTPTLVQLDLTNLKGRMSLLAKHHDGGIDLVGDGGQLLAVVLPAHFPEVPGWVDHGIEFRVLGRATWGSAAILPATSDPIGVWVEARTPLGSRRRTLYLPNLGGVETLEERNGAWIPVNRLVGRGFTDLPAFKRP